MARKRVPNIKIVKKSANLGKGIHKLSIEYREDLLEELKDPDYAAYYLTTGFEEGGLDDFLRALGNVVRALGGIAKMSEETGLGRQNLYNMLSPKGNPTLRNLTLVLEKAGIGISFFARKEAA